MLNPYIDLNSIPLNNSDLLKERFMAELPPTSGPNIIIIEPWTSINPEVLTRIAPILLEAKGMSPAQTGVFVHSMAELVSFDLPNFAELALRTVHEQGGDMVGSVHFLAIEKWRMRIATSVQTSIVDAETEAAIITDRWIQDFLIRTDNTILIQLERLNALPIQVMSIHTARTLIAEAAIYSKNKLSVIANNIGIIVDEDALTPHGLDAVTRQRLVRKHLLDELRRAIKIPEKE